MTHGITTASGITLGYASRPTRLLGQCVDGFIAGAPVLVANFLAPGVLTIFAGIWAFIYLVFSDGNAGQSFAKQWLGMRVVDAKTGEPCTYGQSFLRNILLTFLGPIDWIFIFGDRHQRLGDKAAGTIVVVAD